MYLHGVFLLLRLKKISQLNSVPAVVTAAQSSVGKVVYIDESGEAFPRGSGFFIDHNIFLTSLHGVADEDALYPVMSIKIFPALQQESKPLNVVGVKVVSLLHDMVCLRS